MDGSVRIPLTSRSEDALERAFGVVEAVDYAGYSKHDALNARWLERIAGESRIRRLIVIQLVMRAPLHIRPLIGVRTARNAKGLSLLARAYLSRYRIAADERALAKGRELLDWLCDNPSAGWGYPCWGYPYPWQDVGFFAPRNFPNRVVTSFVVHALLDGYESTGEERYLAVAKGAVDMLLTAPRTLHEDERTRCVSYVPHERIDWIVMDVSALVGWVAARLARITGDATKMDEAGRLIRYVVGKQTEYAAWYYAEPPSASHIRHDNYHTGFILDAILGYGLESGSIEFEEAWRRGLDYYERHLFEPNGAPRFMNDQQYPYDIHGAAQGIITFALAHRHRGTGANMSRKILEWTLNEMFDPKTGWFHYQKRRFLTNRVRLLRWCQGWMALALAHYLEHVEQGADGNSRTRDGLPPRVLCT